ncbi:MAG: FAD-dependent oxidoreductase [Tetrasphaera sp.]
MSANHYSVSAADVLIAGAGLTGLTAGLLLARAGHRVLLVDGDPSAPPGVPAGAGTGWNRAGVRQFHQPHLMLPRWHRHLRTALPDVLEALSSAGAESVNLLHLSPESVTGGWAAEDERFDTLAARRPLLEAVLADVAAREPRLRVLRPVHITGLLTTGSARGLHVAGLRTRCGDLVAGLVVDALGRHTQVPRWLEHTVARQLPTEQQASGFVYYARQFRSPSGGMPLGHGPVLTHHESVSVLTIPQDKGTYAVALVGAAKDPAIRTLRHEDAWTTAARRYPTSAAWVADGIPISPVAPFGVGADVRRRLVDSDGPAATGIIALGDSRATTAPLLGRGATLGLLQALVLRDVLADRPDDPATLIDRVETGIGREVGPWVAASWSFAKHRAAELDAAAAGTAYETVDPAWHGTRALLAGAQRDPVLARCASAIGGLLDAPADLLARPDVAARLVARRAS